MRRRLLLKQAKKRNRKIKITDVAISKVILTKLTGFSKQENLMIQEMHRSILKISKEKNNSGEIGILTDLHTWDMNILIGTEVSVDLRSDLNVFRKIALSGRNTLMFAHNHPSMGTFSAEDVKIFCKYPSLYLISVVGNDGSVYVLKKLFDFDPNVVLEYYYERERYYKDCGEKYTATLAIKDVLKNAECLRLYYRKEARR